MKHDAAIVERPPRASTEHARAHPVRSFGAEAPLGVAVIGCGAMAERQHLPRLMEREDCRVVACVDPDRQRASALGERAGAARAIADYRDLEAGQVGAAIVAAPNHLHAEIACTLLERGIHVLVEKPMALSASDCGAMLQAAQRTGATLAVGSLRRFSIAARFVRHAIARGLLGRIDSFEIRNGVVFRWPICSDYLLSREKSGGGVLFDLGPHALELALSWFGQPDVVAYADDNRGGVEANCEIRLLTHSGTRGVIELSRVRDLTNTALVRGERGAIEIGLADSRITLNFAGFDSAIAGSVVGHGRARDQSQDIADMVRAEHDDFLSAVRAGIALHESSLRARRIVDLIETCYAARRRLTVPWERSSNV